MYSLYILCYIISFFFAKSFAHDHEYVVGTLVNILFSDRSVRLKKPGLGSPMIIFGFSRIEEDFSEVFLIRFDST